ncbi:MAG: isopentenyl-diphosphate Delta-isomerase [Sphingobacteriales bacterium]|jgi:isopentenyl-diphosphate delta-isomerase|nr:isopentenyl-diphosphate Delta-isomerase [Sphingobacteriales bacterium]MBP9140117.1 isopentenyl-diphosphate Delta-isomerase [Chitinophagales bacterium]MDA0198231.1 isopentenyl-diphosphate Delta-isomerase [Bacteroidota bacterium]MBK6889978.1 isopentenyl-diphosphate Delta-isomerase [Sphingobacteriales bacterium]MBK7527499.1 isopentenyl-diphosphate Delta-isomerase [Sphingobacteriales bacterium]
MLPLSNLPTTTDTNSILNYDYVVLTNLDGEVLGTEEKIAAHQKALLHMAFSVLVFNKQGQMLLQQRAFNKYHFGGLWSNTCCSHQRLNESDEAAAHRRLYEELGFDLPLKHVLTFVYKAHDPKTNLTEHERDLVFIGIYNGEPILPNPNEVAAIKWISLADLFLDMNLHPDNYTYWFKVLLEHLRERELLAVTAIAKLFDESN